MVLYRRFAHNSKAVGKIEFDSCVENKNTTNSKTAQKTFAAKKENIYVSCSNLNQHQIVSIDLDKKLNENLSSLCSRVECGEADYYDNYSSLGDLYSSEKSGSSPSYTASSSQQSATTSTCSTSYMTSVYSSINGNNNADFNFMISIV